jgi:hypothetical protein
VQSWEKGIKKSIIPVSSLNDERRVRFDHVLDLLLSLSKGQGEVVYGVGSCCVGNHFFRVAMESFQTCLG